MQSRFRLAAPILVTGLAGSLAAVALAATSGAPVIVKEDAGGAAPDLVRAELRRASDGRLRAAVNFAQGVSVKSLVSKAGPSGSICVRIYTTATPGALPPDFLVCATPDSKGRTLKAAVFAEQVNALPKRVAGALVTRASSRSVVMRFSQSSVGKPAVIRFAAEASRAGCTRLSCVDTLPDSPKTAKLLLRAEAP